MLQQQFCLTGPVVTSAEQGRLKNRDSRTSLVPGLSVDKDEWDRKPTKQVCMYDSSWEKAAG